jgi:acetoin utilization protein AcuB
MTSVIVCTEPRQTLRAARELLRAHDIRHLPVLARGKVVGLVSERDVQLFLGLEDVDVDDARVEDAMTTDVYAVPPDADLGEVCGRMAARKLGSAVVMSGGQLLGIFTTIDALRAVSLLHPRVRRQPGTLQPLPRSEPVARRVATQRRERAAKKPKRRASQARR